VAAVMYHVPEHAALLLPLAKYVLIEKFPVWYSKYTGINNEPGYFAVL
jgi:hypothetical protein